MGSKNQFDLLVDVESDDPSHLVAAAAKKAAASPKPATAAPAAPAKLPTKPPPPAQAGKFLLFLSKSDRKGGGGPFIVWVRVGLGRFGWEMCACCVDLSPSLVDLTQAVASHFVPSFISDCYWYINSLLVP